MHTCDLCTRDPLRTAHRSLYIYTSTGLLFIYVCLPFMSPTFQGLLRHEKEKLSGNLEIMFDLNSR